MGLLNTHEWWLRSICTSRSLVGSPALGHAGHTHWCTWPVRDLLSLAQGEDSVRADSCVPGRYRYVCEVLCKIWLYLLTTWSGD